MYEIVAALAGAVVGAFISAHVGWRYQQRQIEAQEQSKKSLLVSGLIHDLEASIGLYQKLQQEYGSQQVIPLWTIRELIDARQFYNRNRDWLILVEDKELRHRIAGYFRTSANDIDVLNNNEELSMNLSKEFSTIVSNIMLANPGLTKEAAEKKVFEAAPQYSRDFNNAKAVTASKMPCMELHKQEAIALKSILENWPQK